MNAEMSITHTPAYYPIIDAAPLSVRTRIQYKRALDRMTQAGIDPRNSVQLGLYAASLPASSRAFLKAALNVVFASTATRLKAGANRDNLADVQASLLNLDAMNEAIQTRRDKGTRHHTWLSREQVEQITSLPNNRRDYIVLATLLGVGLRRLEMAELTFDALKQQPAKNGMRDVLEVTGKGGKSRVIPISRVLAGHLREWHKTVGDGRVARAINRHGTVNGSLTEHNINVIVAKYGGMIGIPELTAHDMRRSYAMIGYTSGVPIEQISLLLGHADVKTTMIYLNIKLDVDNTISDYIPLSIQDPA
jgi:integrase